MDREYPKYLYSGDKGSYSSRIIHNAEEEQQFRNIGFVDYDDLSDPVVEENEVPQGFVTTEQFDSVAERLATAELEIERLKQSAS